MVPVVDLVEIGNGGGSIAWVDDFGKLHVGPQSAGAVPGPGGLRPRRHRGDDDRRQPRARPDQPRLLLRRRDRRRHGRRRPTRSTRSRARLGVDRVEAARGIVRIANNNMVNALKLVSRQPRLRPARLHARRVRRRRRHARRRARRASSASARSSIPRAADVFSAWGMLMSDLRRDYFVTRLIEPDAPRTPPTARRAARRGRERRRWSSSRARGSRPSQVRFLRYGKLRYENQEHTRRGAAARRRDRRGRRRGRSRRLPRARTSASTPTGSTRRSSSSASTSSRSPRSASSRPRQLPVTGPAARGRARRASATSTTRPSGVHEAAIYDGELLEPGHALRRARRSSRRRARTTVVHPGNSATVDELRQPRHRDRRRRRDRRRVRPDHARDHPELAAGDQRRDVRRVPQDGDERDHLRGARHGHRHHRRATATSPPPAPASRPSSACSTRR